MQDVVLEKMQSMWAEETERRKVRERKAAQRRQQGANFLRSNVG